MISQNPKPVVAVVVAIIEDSANRILALKRSPDREWSPNLWNIISGHIEDGEDPFGAVCREIEEEVGMNVELREAFPLYDVDYEGKIWRTSAYRFLSKDEKPKLNEEHVDFCWVPRADLARFEFIPLVFEDFRKMNYFSRNTL